MGVQLLLDPESGSVFVSDVTRGGPAERAGIRPGDVVVEVDGMDVGDATPEVVASKCRGRGGERRQYFRPARADGNRRERCRRRQVHSPDRDSRKDQGEPRRLFHLQNQCWEESRITEGVELQPGDSQSDRGREGRPLTRGATRGGALGSRRWGRDGWRVRGGDGGTKRGCQ